MPSSTTISRAVVAARWGYAENAVALRETLKAALASRGRPAQVYVDNGACFVDAGLRRACAVLGIKLTHSQPGRPAGRGKIERFFRTVRDQFLVEISADPGSAGTVVDSLAELNGLFTAWVEQIRRLPAEAGGYTVGVLVQANHGLRDTLTIAGVPVGKEITDLMPELHPTPGTRSRVRLGKTSSIIVIVGTDAPLLPHQLDRLARRAALGIGIVGGRGDDTSGDIGIAFSTAHVLDLNLPPTQQVRTVTLLHTDPLLYAAVQATEEAIVNALIAAKTMTGINGNRVHAIPHRRLQRVLRKYNRLND